MPVRLKTNQIVEVVLLKWVAGYVHIIEVCRPVLRYGDSAPGSGWNDLLQIVTSLGYAA